MKEAITAASADPREDFTALRTWWMARARSPSIMLRIWSEKL